MTDLTEAIRDKIESLRRAKQKRYEQTCNQLDSEIHQKTNLSRELFEKFEQAVSVYQRESESPGEIIQDGETQVDEQLAALSNQILDEIENSAVLAVDERAPPSPPPFSPSSPSGAGASLDGGRLPTFEQVANGGGAAGGDDANGGDKSYGALGVLSVTDSTHSHATTKRGSSTAKNVAACDESDEEAEDPLTPRRKAIQKAHARCVELKRENELVEESLRKTRSRLQFAREDYQRSLQHFDDLERELCTISETFEENQKRALENFFAGLNDKDVDVYEEYRKFQEVTSHGIGERRVRKRRDVDALQEEVRRAKRSRNAALLTAVAAVAPWVGQVALMAWEKYSLNEFLGGSNGGMG